MRRRQRPRTPRALAAGVAGDGLDIERLPIARPVQGRAKELVQMPRPHLLGIVQKLRQRVPAQDARRDRRRAFQQRQSHRGDDAQLPATAQHIAKAIRVWRQLVDAAVGRHQCDLRDMTGLQAAAQRRVADAANRQRAGEGHAQVVGQHRRTQALRRELIDQRQPGGAAFHRDLARRPIDVQHAIQPAHIEDDSTVAEHLPTRAVSGAAHLPRQAPVPQVL